LIQPTAKRSKYFVNSATPDAEGKSRAGLPQHNDFCRESTQHRQRGKMRAE
jgi:hypothetical protein